MTTVWLRKTHVVGLFRGSDGRLFVREEGVERRCCRCRRWTHTVYKWADHRVCGRHVRVSTKTRIRVLTTFACRVFHDGLADLPPAGCCGGVKNSPRWVGRRRAGGSTSSRRRTGAGSSWSRGDGGPGSSPGRTWRRQ